MTKNVAALCVSPVSIYKRLEGVDAYDQSRDARTFAGGMPIVAHPPCRSWSNSLRHQAKPEPGERELALWLARDVLHREGGVSEQPALSHLFVAAKLPLPGEMRRRDFFTLQVDQSWWGFPITKATWLCFSRIDRYALTVPWRPHDVNGDRERWARMSKHQRAATCEPFALWLIDAARKAA